MSDIWIVLPFLVPMFLLFLFIGPFGRMFGVPEKALERLARSLHFERDGDTFRGTWNGVPVTMTYVDKRVQVHAPAPPDVTVRNAQAFTAAPGERVRTGDRSIDAQLAFYGPRDRLVAALDGGARVNLRELFMGSMATAGSVEGGRVSRTLLSSELAPGTVSILLNTVTELSRALHVEPDAPRLSGIARSDLYPDVRMNALEVLSRLHPGQPTEAVARDLLDDPDRDVRVAAAKLAGELGALRLAAGDPEDLDYAVEDDPEGLPGRLAVLPEAVLLQALKRARYAGRGAVAEALARVGSLEAVEPLLAGGFKAQARAIQARLASADAGALSLADAQGGEVSIVAEAGAVSLVRPAAAKERS